MSKKSPQKPLEPWQAIMALQSEKKKLRAALRKLISRCDDLESAISGTTDQFETEVSKMSAAVTAADKILKGE